MRVTAFIDGFNLYHSVADIKRDYLKWLNLRLLCEQFVPSSDFDLTQIFYFSAFATWKPNAYKRHREYLKALHASGVKTVMGRFKKKDLKCFNCGVKWKSHEEKETDVNIALHMLLEGFKNSYDLLLLISGDSDLSPAVRMVRDNFPEKKVNILFPYARNLSGDLISAAGGRQNTKKMKLIHIERSLFGKDVRDSNGTIVAVRPEKYTP